MKENAQKKYLSVQKSEFGRRYNKRQVIFKSNAIKSIMSTITRHGENDERYKSILSAPKLNWYDN